MPIRTAHGTVIVSDPATGRLRHVPIPSARPDLLVDPPLLRSAGYAMVPAGQQGTFHLQREGLYLCAEQRSDVLNCDRSVAGGWETFSLIDVSALPADTGESLTSGFLRDYQLGNLKQAISGLETVVAHYPGNHAAQLHLGLARALLDPLPPEPPRLFLQCRLEDLWEHEWLTFLLGDLFGAASADGAYRLSARHMVVIDHALTAEKALYYREAFKCGQRVCLIHLGDEGYVEDLSAYQWCHTVWRNYWSPILARQPNIRFFPLGAKSGFSAGAAPPRGEARHLWSFAGDAKKSSRPRMIEALRRVPGGYLHLTSHFGSEDSLPTGVYRRLLEQTQFVPCPAGLSNLETFRVYEALEAGAIPILESRPGFDYFRHLLGDHPMPSVVDWDEAPGLIERIQAIGGAGSLQKSCAAWWRVFKRILRDNFAASIANLGDPRY